MPVFYPADRLLREIECSCKILLPDAFFVAKFFDPVIQCMSHPLVIYIYYHLFYPIDSGVLSECNVLWHSYSGYQTTWTENNVKIESGKICRIPRTVLQPRRISGRNHSKGKSWYAEYRKQPLYLHPSRTAPWEKIQSEKTSEG